MKSAHEPGEVTWVEAPGGRATADLIAEALISEAQS
jgi:hypothetical protein